MVEEILAAFARRNPRSHLAACPTAYIVREPDLMIACRHGEREHYIP